MTAFLDEHLGRRIPTREQYLGLPMPNPCLVDRFPEERHPRYIPSEEDFWKV